MKNIYKASYFESIYDKYAAVMYGCILNIVKEKNQAEAILRSIFLDLPSEHNFTKETDLGASWFIKLAMKKSFIFLKEYNSNDIYKSRVNEIFSLTKLSLKQYS